MKVDVYGLIGTHVAQSFSKQIHESFANYPYHLIKLADKDEMKQFIDEKAYKGLNVTIPFKVDVIPLLDMVDERAQRIGAVNTVVNKAGKLYGYNTDYDGLRHMIEKNGIEIKDKNVAILGTGGTSKTAACVCEDLKAQSIIKVSRTKLDDAVSYSELEDLDIQILINTTPVGMFPHNDELVVSLDTFNNLEAVVDVIYNPLKTRLILEAEKRNLKTAIGLEMLVYQALKASELFLDCKYDQSLYDETYHKILKSLMNIVLIGMPAAGKTTVGKALAEELVMDFVDSDEEIIIREQRSIPQIFKESKEDYFRDVEQQVIAEISKYHHHVIATGGGVVLNDKNIERLAQNGIIIYLDRDLKLLKAGDQRPLLTDNQALVTLYNERVSLYTQYSDRTYRNNSTIEEVVKRIVSEIS